MKTHNLKVIEVMVKLTVSLTCVWLLSRKEIKLINSEDHDNQSNAVLKYSLLDPAGS